MNCWHCKNELVWMGDHDLTDSDADPNFPYDLLTDLRCPVCECDVEVYRRKEVPDDGQDTDA